VIDGSIRLISERLASTLFPDLRRRFHRLNFEGRPPVLVRWDVPRLVEESESYLPDFRVAGRAAASP
jgi:hypothetical protein